MVQFGVIKGFLRRVYGYPIWIDHPQYQPSSGPTPLANGSERAGGGSGGGGDARRGERYGSASSGVPGPSSLSTDQSASERSRGPRRPEMSERPSAASVSSSALSTSTASLSLSVSREQEQGRRQGQGQQRTSAGYLAPASLAMGIGAPVKGTGLKALYPTSLPLMLDGAHHTDEICLRYGIGFGHLEKVLRAVGGVADDNEQQQRNQGQNQNRRGSGTGRERERERDFGRVCWVFV